MRHGWSAAAMVVLLAGMAGGACRHVPPAPAPVPPAPAPPPPPPVILDGDGYFPVCVVKNGVMTRINVEYDPATGDTTVNGRPFSETYPMTAEYASTARWYVDNEPVSFAGGRYVKEGLPRELNVGDVVPVGTYHGVTVFVEPGQPRVRPEVLYFPVAPACLFEPYIAAEVGYPVRG